MNPFANLPSARRLWRSPRKARSGAIRVPRGFRPMLESLEDRCVPSVTTLFTQPANVNQTVAGGPAGSDLTNIIRISGTNLGGFEFANDITSSSPTVNDYINLVAVDQISNYTEVGGNAHRTSFGNNTVALIYAMQAQVTGVTVSGGVTNVSVKILGGALGLYPIPASNYDPLHVAKDGATDALTGLTFNNPLALYTLNTAANVEPGLDGEGDFFPVDQLNQASPSIGTPSLSQGVMLISTTNPGGFITSLPGRNVTSLVGLTQAQIQANGTTLAAQLTTADQNALNTIFSHLVPGANTLSKFANFGGGGATDFTVSNDGSSGDVIQSFNINSDPTGEAPDVDITKTADNPTITAGQTAGFTVTIFNEGQTTATGVTLTDPLPAGTGGDVNWTIDTTTGNPADFAIIGSPGNQSLVLSASFLASDTLAPGASISVHITSPTNGADTSATTFTGTLPNTATVNDDQETAPADQASATITILAPDVDITKTADNSTITAGQQAGFTVTITNEGLATATGVTLTDPLPAGTGSDVNWSIDTTTGNPADFAITGSVGHQSLVLSASFLASDTLAAGASISVHITSPTNGADTSATTFTGTLSNTATVTAPNQAGGETSDQSSATITILAPDVDITKTADNSTITAGQTAGFTITITNEGLATATGIVLSDPLPAGTGGDVNWRIDSSTGNPADFAITGSVGHQSLVLSASFLASDSLAAGASILVHITSPTNGADTSATTFTGTLPNTATVTAPNQAGGETSDQSSATITILAPDVDITKTADNSTITAGQTAGFTITITNEGLATATGIVLSDPLPAGTGGDVNWSIDTTTGNPGDFAITGTLGHQSLVLSAAFLASDTLAAGASISVHLTSPTNTGDAPGGTGTLPNTATVTAPNQAGGETSDKSSATITITTGGAPVSAGEFATIGFWHNKNGQAVINSFNGSSTSTLLGNWLASTFPKLFGASNPYTGTSLAGLTNAQVATVYANLWNPSGVTKNTYVQAFAVALGIYADTSSLGFNDTAKKFGFVIAPGGGGAATFNVGNNGAAFGVANGTTLTVMQILQAANDNFSPTTGLFYGGDQTLTSDLNNVLNGINTKGDIS